MGCNLIRAWLLHLILLLASALPYEGEAQTLEIQASQWESGPVELKGNWALYWGRFLEPSDFQNPQNLPAPISMSVPGLWTSAPPELGLKAHHFASYRAEIILPAQVVQDKQLLTLRIPDAPGAYQVWLNQRLRERYGKIGRNEAEEIPETGARYITFIPEQRRLEIIMQTSSFHNRSGGMWFAPTLAPADTVGTWKARALAADAFVLSALFVMTFYHLSLYKFRPENKTALMFAIYCLTVTIRSSVTGSDAIVKLFYPGLSQNFQKMCEYGGFYAAVPAFYAFVLELYPQNFSKMLSRILWVLGGIFLLTVVIFPVRIFSNFVEYYQAITAIVGVIVLVQITGVIRQRREGYILYVLGSLFTLLTTLNDILHAHRMAPIAFFIAPYGLFFMILLQSIQLALRFSNAFRQIETHEVKIQSLNEELIVQNQKLAEEISIRGAMAANAAHHLNNPLQAMSGLASAVACELTKIRERLEGIFPAEADLGPEEAQVIESFRSSFRKIADDQHAVDRAIKRATTVSSELRLVSGIHGTDMQRSGLATFWQQLTQEIADDDVLGSRVIEVDPLPVEAARYEFWMEPVSFTRPIFYVLKEGLEMLSPHDRIHLCAEFPRRTEGRLFILAVTSTSGRLKVDRPDQWRELKFCHFLLQHFGSSIILEPSPERLIINLALPEEGWIS
jgi:signal transduction histidine kinase